ncbi:MAG: type I DNA topoisomerase [Candidatus Komeilibacteria bacterium]
MSKKLAIVESPTKAKTISRFLGKDWDVQSSFGHIRDLPKSKLGVDPDNNFEPEYVIPTKAKKAVANLKKRVSKDTEVYLATDEDREGEAIAWHLIHALKLKPENTKRIAFHEITKTAVEEAIANPRELDNAMVDAQQARRILDRIVGYKLSPWLWKKVAKGLSAGRVQSVAVRLIVEREKEIEAFKADEYWTILGEFKKGKDVINAQLSQIDNKRIAKLDINNEEAATKIKEDAEKLDYTITEVNSRQEKKNPPTPLTTSLLQQEANRKLGFSSKQTMMLAQQLYEGIELGGKESEGLITYMRTDSQNLSDKFINEARNLIESKFGKDYLPKSAKIYKTKSKNAQEAHEAIRPTNVNHEPDNIKSYLNDKQYKLYRLIWNRSVASQMQPAEINVTSISIADKDNKYVFTASGSVIKFTGYLEVYSNFKGSDLLPACNEKDKVDLDKIVNEQHFTKPPARYSDAGLVKELEKKGIGRPSTYAPIISTIIARNYVTREEKRLKPTEIGTVVTDLLLKHFSKIMDYTFTANMEEDLDEISLGKKEWQPVINNFYMPFMENLDNKYEEVKKDDLVEKTDEQCEKCGSDMIIKMGRFGKFMACSNYPECKNTKQIGKDNKPEEEEKIDEQCEKCGADMTIKRGRFGKFMACTNYPDCKNTKQIVEETGASCPDCGKGKIVAKGTKTGRTFYACDQYPSCKFALWQKPNGETCPECKSLLVFGKEDKIFCSNKECNYTK